MALGRCTEATLLLPMGQDRTTSPNLGPGHYPVEQQGICAWPLAVWQPATGCPPSPPGPRWLWGCPGRRPSPPRSSPHPRWKWRGLQRDYLPLSSSGETACQLGGRFHLLVRIGPALGVAVAQEHQPDGSAVYCSSSFRTMTRLPSDLLIFSPSMSTMAVWTQ